MSRWAWCYISVGAACFVVGSLDPGRFTWMDAVRGVLTMVAILAAINAARSAR